MTREHVKALLPVLQAYAEGKEILVMGRPASRPVDMNFEGHPEDYSIKPEPLEIEVWIDTIGVPRSIVSQNYNDTGGTQIWTKKKFREVVE